MTTIVYVDFYNLMFRNAHTSGKTASIDDKIGMMMHKLMTSLLFVQRKFGADHIMLATDHNSWRKKVYPEYKLNRVTARMKKTPKEQEEDGMILDAAKDFFEFFRTQTKVLSVRYEGAEADDVIATNVLDNPDCTHIIMSTDRDYYQLVSNNVFMYDPTMKLYFTLDGVLDEFQQPVIDTKTDKPKHLGEPEWSLFMKCIRGDASDNIKTAYPRVREKGTKKKAGILEAYNDRHTRAYDWFTIMHHEWEDGFGNKHLVKDLYERNRELIDLRKIPQWVQDGIRLDILSQFEMKDEIKANQIGFAFMRFCSKWELYAIGERSSDFVKILS